MWERRHRCSYFALPQCCGASVAILALASASCGRVGFDSSEPDAPIDAAITPIDATNAQTACSTDVDTSALALYTFDQDVGNEVLDTQGANPGAIVGNVTRTAGPFSECGQALRFEGELTDYARVDDSASWTLENGSIDLWFRIDALPNEYFGLISKDSGGTVESGHLTVLVSSTGRLLSRYQEGNANDSEGVACSAEGAIVVGAWNHMGVNFGTNALSELWLNGIAVDEPGSFDILDCQTAKPASMDNREAWVFGVAQWQSSMGLVTPSDGGLIGAIDHVRVSNVVRDFSGPEYQPPTD